MKNKAEREKIADVKLAAVFGRRSDSAHSFTLLVSGLCAQSLVSASSDAGWPNKRFCFFPQQILELGFQNQQCK